MKFDYSTNNQTTVEDCSFSVYFNNHFLTKVRPARSGVFTAVFTVYGHVGTNMIEFEHNNVANNYNSAIIDNVGVYQWKNNEICYNWK